MDGIRMDEIERIKSNLNFINQLANINAPCGLIYYMVKYERQYGSYEDCFDGILGHLISVNDYDPMQLHGVKTIDELTDMATFGAKKEYQADQEREFSLKKLAVNILKVDDYESNKLKIEDDDDFIRWMKL